MKKILREYTQFFIKYKYQVFTAILGAILSTLFFIIYAHFKTIVWLNIILVIISLVFAVFQTYKLYFKDKNWDNAAKVILSLLFFLLFIIFAFTVITIVCISILKLPFNSSYIMYAIYSMPAFVFVIVLFMLIIASIGYL